MLDSNDLREQDSPDHSACLHTLQQHFGKRQDVFLTEKRTLQQRRIAPREQRSFLHEYRQSFAEARQRLWNRQQQHLLETGTLDQVGFQQRLEGYREFEDFIRRQQAIFQQFQLVFQQRLASLHDRRLILRELGRDYDQWQQGYQQFKEELRKQLEIMREQQAAYLQIQSDALFL